MLDLGEHPVERGGQSSHLGARITFRHPAIQLAAGDRRGRLFDLGQRPQAPVHHREAGEPHHGEDRHPDADLQPDQ